jgi:hypothetical protein
VDFCLQVRFMLIVLLNKEMLSFIDVTGESLSWETGDGGDVGEGEGSSRAHAK